MKKLVVIYSPDGVALPDHLVEETILEHVNSNRLINTIVSSTENILHCVRFLKVTGKISCEINLYYNSHEIILGKNCKIISWPKEFPSYNDKWTIGIINKIVENQE